MPWRLSVGPRASRQFHGFPLARGDTHAAPNTHGTINDGTSINLYGADRASFGASSAGIARLLIRLRYERRRRECRCAHLEGVKYATTITAAVADLAVDVDRMNQPILVALPQQLQHLVVGQFPGHAVLHRPPAQGTGVNAGVKHVFAGVARVNQRPCQTTGARRNAPMPGPLYGLREILSGECILGKGRPGGPYRRIAEPEFGQGQFGVLP